MVFVFLMSIALIGNATEISRPGLHVKSIRKSVLKPAIDPRADYTGGIAPAIAASIRGNGNGGGNQAQNPRKVVLENYANHDIMVEIVIAYFPGGIDAQQIMNNTGVRIIPGYEPRTIRVAKKSFVQVMLKPGDYDVRVYDLTRRTGHNLVANSSIHVDVNPGSQVSSMASTSCDFLWFYR